MKNSSNFKMIFNNDIIITAMDRFVWFVLLVVMSHLVTEYTRVIGQQNESTKATVTVNDTFMLSKLNVENNFLYPNDQRFSKDNPQHKQRSILANIFSASGQQQMPTEQQQNQHRQSQSQQQQSLNSSFFNFRPIIDSIFEIPISTLRAVNNLVTRLTGAGYSTPSTKITNEQIIPYQHELRDSLNLPQTQVKVKPEKILQLSEKSE